MDENKRTVPFSPPDVGEAEIAEVAAALRSGWITTGPRTKLLERRLAAYVESGRVDVDCDEAQNAARYSDRVVCLGSATAAEELDLRVLGVGPGDEVIVPAYTYTASASAAAHCGAKIVFVDIRKDGDPDTRAPLVDPERIAAAITPRTKAVIAVDLGGVVCDYDAIFEAVESKRALFTPKKAEGDLLSDLSARIQSALGRVAVVADCAHALGASRTVGGVRKNCGAIADFTSFSFHAVKNLTTAEGGAATWRGVDGVDDAEIYMIYQLLSLHGQSKDAFHKNAPGAWEYDVIGPWYKCNMTDVAASIGLRQLDRYPGLIERRRQIIARYDETCDSLGVARLVHSTPECESSKHLYLARIPGADEATRNRAIEKMAQLGVATNVHYKPLPMMTAYGGDCSAFPNSFDYYRNLITLPLHTRLSDEDVEYVCDCFRRVIGEIV